MGMSLYEIENAILDCVDMETGEIVDCEKLEDLQMERDSVLFRLAFASVFSTASSVLKF